MSISANLAVIQDRTHAAARRAKRSPEEITLMAVTKTVPPQQIREAYAAGLRIFGENRVQEFATKIQQLSDLQAAEWHMIGHLQSNKSTKAAELFTHVDSVDSLRLAQKLNSAATQLGKEDLGKKLPILIEINIGGESAKTGLDPNSRDLQHLLTSAPELTSLHIRGLMTVPPYNDDPEQSRSYFRKMRSLFSQIAARKLPAVHMEVLSMGMSHDFEIAIEESATCIRIGAALFGARPAARK